MAVTDAETVPNYGAVRSVPNAEPHHEKPAETRRRTVSSRYEPLATDDGLRHCAVINKGTDEELTARGYCRSLPHTALCWLATALLALTPLLLARWRPDWRLRLTHRRCALRDATAVLLTDAHGRTSVEPVVREQAGPATPPQFRISGPGDCEAETETGDSSPLLPRRQQDQVWGEWLGLQAIADQSKGYLRYFWSYHLKYTWDQQSGRFVQLSGLDRDVSVHSLLEDYTGYSEDQQQARLSLYGENQITVEVKSYLKLLVEEALNPFYIFQVGSLTLWAIDNYRVYAACIFLISVISIAISLYETRKQSETLRDMVLASAVSTVTVRRADGEMVEVCSERLVPGDVLVLPESGCTMACDAVLVAGSCIVNESMLTGESVPVTKTQLTQQEDSEMFSPETHKRHILFCGTKVIQTRYYGRSPVLAVVIRTGFNTAKGELIRSILFPKPMGFKFYQDSMKFIGVMFLLSLSGMAFTVYTYISRGASVKVTLLRALDIITIAVPPALPAAMTVGTVYAQNRLKVANIFCISPPRINVCGKLKLFCFDKTGTLTEDGLSMWGVVPCSPAGFSSPQRDVSALSDGSELKVALASCHGLTRLAGQLIGDPLDIKMFEATDWELEEPVETDANKFDLLAPTVVRPRRAAAAAPVELAPELAPELTPEVGIVRQFPFSSSSQRMSVICRTLGRRHMDLYCKGAPEKVEGLCRPDSVPVDFASVLHEYTVKGYRVLALAYRRLDSKLHWHQAQRLKRDQVECDMELTGLLVMQNSLKPETTPVITTLERANIRCVMVTGDNLLTAVSVARECGMIPAEAAAVVVTAHPPSSEHPSYVEYTSAAADVAPVHPSANEVTVPLWAGLSGYRLAVTGRSWRVLQQHFPHLLPRIVVQGTVFARMAPEQKAQLVEALQDQGYTVGMCGDGANDCEALKAAHVGISLSEAEASVAAPFTSKVANITCVPTVMREGRCALTTSFGTFKYMALYSMIQFVSVLLLYEHYSNLGDMQFLYIDLIITTTVAVLMGYTAAAPKLHRRRPPGSLLGATTLVSILVQIALAAAAQLCAMWLLERQPWFKPVPPNGADRDVTTVCWENTVVFFASSYQYLILATAFSKGPPFRRPFYTNRLFLSALLVLSALQTTLVLWPEPHLVSWFGLAPPRPDDRRLRYSLLAVTAGHCLLALFVETYVVGAEWFKRALRPCSCKKGPKNQYKLVARELECDAAWPPVGQKELHTAS